MNLKCVGGWIVSTGYTGYGWKLTTLRQSQKAFTRPSLISERNSIRRIFKTLRYVVLPQTTTPVPPNTFDLVCNKIKMFSDYYCTLYSSA